MTNVGYGRSDYPAAGSKNEGAVVVIPNYKPTPYPDDVVNYRHKIIHEELPDNTWCGTELQVFVRKVNSPSEFWINLFGMNYSRKLVILCAEMRLFYKERHERYLLPSYAVRAGQFCVCLYGNEWHRVKIVNAIGKDLVDVFLVDCGSKVTVSADNLCFMHKKFSDLPMQSFRANLPYIKPRSSAEWPTSVCDFFRQQTSGRKFRAKVVDVVREIHAVSLILIDVNGNSVSDKLLSNNMAEAETEGDDSPDATRNEKPVDSNPGATFVKVDNITRLPDEKSSHSSDESLPDKEEAYSSCTDAPISRRTVSYRDVIIAGKTLLFVTIKDKHYFVLSDFLHAFAMVHEHVVLKLLETFPTPVVVEKMDDKCLRVILDSLGGRWVRGMTDSRNPSVHLLPVNVACELLTFLGEDSTHNIFLRKFVSSLY